MDRTPHGHGRAAPYPTPLSRSTSGTYDSPTSTTPQSPSPFQSFSSGTLTIQGSQREYPYDSNPLGPTFPTNNSFVNGVEPVRVDALRLITHFSTFLGLDEKHSQAAHEFNGIIDPMTRLAVGHVHVLAVDQQLKDFHNSIGKITQQLDENNKLLKAAWKLSDAQEDALKALLLNYLIRPLNSYKALYEQAMTYISTHRSKYHLDAFLTDEVIRATILAFLKSKLNDSKSLYRKALWKRVHYSLDTLAELTIHDCHLSPGTIKDEEREKIRAVLALQRKVALPLAARPGQKGADTGFWSGIEAELRKLIVAHGSDRNSPGWKKWEKDIIIADKALHTSNSQEQEQEEDELMNEPTDGT